MVPAKSPAPRVLHCTLTSIFGPGVYQQLTWEKQAAEAEGIPWDTRIFTSVSRPDPASLMVRWQPRGRVEATRWGRWLAFRRAYYDWLAENAEHYDIVLLRSSPYDPFRAGGIRALSSAVGLVGSVHHTIEVPELLLQRPRIKGLLLSTGERVLGPRSIGAADVIVGVTAQIAAAQVERIGRPLPTFVYPNGALLSETVQDTRGHRPELLFMAGRFEPWHGLDLLLESLAGTTEDFTLHVAGIVDPVVMSECSDPRVVFHGFKEEDDLRTLMESAWIGISSLAHERHRISGSPLKVGAYLAQGVPVYGGPYEVVPATSPVYRVGEPDIAQMLEFAHRMRSMPREKVRDAAAAYVDKRVLVRELYSALSTLSRQPAT